MSSPKQVALVVGASRGIGRQVAIDLARSGYKGKPSSLTAVLRKHYLDVRSCRVRKEYIGCIQRPSVPARPQLLPIYNQYCGSRDRGSWR